MERHKRDNPVLTGGPAEGCVDTPMDGFGAGTKTPTAEPVLRTYQELRSFAAALLRSERPDHSLQATALVHEAWARLAKGDDGEWRDPREFFAIATRVMEQVLVDHARRRASLKRGGPGNSGRRRSVDDAAVVTADDEMEPAVDVEQLRGALVELEVCDARAAELVRLRFFCGLRVDQAAAVLSVSVGTAEGDWRIARAWLTKRLGLSIG